MARHVKRTGKSEVIARLRRAEGWNDKRYASSFVHDCDYEPRDCSCAVPEDNDEGVCMNCGLCINYKTTK